MVVETTDPKEADMTRLPLLAAALAMLTISACAPPPPYSNAQGPGFDTPAQAALRRDAQLAGTAPLQPYAPPGPVTGGDFTDAQTLANDTRTALGQPIYPGTSGFDPIAAPGPTFPVDLDRDNPSISQEQDFDVVSQERGIEADAERLRQARAQYQVVTPTEIQRPADVGPNIFGYALNGSRPVGTSGAYGRGLIASAGRAAPKCATYSSADLAQGAFLTAGGPERDRLGLDPDGDGNACSWDPAVVRNLVQQ